MGSTSDMPVMKKAAEFLNDVETPFEHLQPAVVEAETDVPVPTPVGEGAGSGASPPDDVSASDASEYSVAVASVCPCGDVHERVTECATYHDSISKWTDLFTVDQVWISDSGCPDDLVAEHKVHDVRNRLEIVPKKTFRTANGKIKATKGLRLSWTAPLCQTIQAMPYVLQATPSVLSMGQRCMRDGATFIWLHDHHQR